jgi:sulfide dehydrogenase [flavocytochrome c] flavoprotein chain
MTQFSRRNFLKVSGAAAAAGTFGCASGPAIGGANKKVVIVGGGIGGATAAKYIRMADSSIDVTVIEPNKHYYTCFMSNEVLGGTRTMDSIEFGYDGLRGHGVKVVHDMVTGIDANARKVTTKGGDSFMYDRCIVSPGVSFRWDQIEGYDEKVAEKIPHAWKAGEQTRILHKQLMDMKDGGTFIIAPPPNPFRCPPGPYERVSQVASYFKQHKPKSKILILDPKDKFSKFGLFNAGWKKHYGYGTDNSMIEWINGAGGGKLEAVDAANMTLKAEVDDYKGDVLNVIPAQKAGTIASLAGLTNAKGWCPVDLKTFESTIHKNVHVIGDAAVQSPLPKSGYAANSEAKVCAAAIVAMLNDMETPQPSYVNTCYSMITPTDGISVAMVYRYNNGTKKIDKVKGSGGLTPGYDKSTDESRRREVEYAHSWFKNITADTFG